MRTALLAIVLLVTPVWAAEAPPACPFAAGALPADTLPPGTPHGASIPIDHIVVLMQENHSFENYFGHLHPSAQRHLANPDPTALAGAPIIAFHDPHTCVPHGLDLDHSWTGSHRQWDGGAMDGFTAANVDPQDPTGRRTMAYYTRADLPFYYGLAREFGIGARYFCSVLGPTYPNRMYLFAGTSFGHIQNDFPSSPTEFSQPTILNLLDAHGITWREYVSDVPMFIFFAYVRDHPANVVPIAQYFADAAAGTLPQVAFLDARGFGTLNQESDEHPPANVQVGEEFGAGVVAALMASPDWARSALFLTYDEHGGYFDPSPHRQLVCPTTSRRCSARRTRRPRSIATGSACRWSWSRRMRGATSFRTSSMTTRRSCASSRPGSTCRPSRGATRTPLRCSSSFMSRGPTYASPTSRPRSSTLSVRPSAWRP